MTPSTNSEISDERLAEMLAGLEGVTPGPWVKEMEQDEEGDLPAFYVSSTVTTSCNLTVVARTGEASPRARTDASHIARCDPDTIRYLVTQELSRRSANSAGGVEAADWLLAAQTFLGSDDFAAMQSLAEAFATDRRAGVNSQLKSASSLHPTEGAEPVAWMLRTPLGCGLTHDETEAKIWTHGGIGTVTPLYTRSSPVSAEVTVTDEMVGEAMQDAWDDICSDTDCHPLDIERQGRSLFFRPAHWSRSVAMHLRAALSALNGKE